MAMSNWNNIKMKNNRTESLLRVNPEQEISEKESVAFDKEFARIRHIYNSAMQVVSTQLDILVQEFAANFDHSPIHHLECRFKSLSSIIGKLQRERDYIKNPKPNGYRSLHLSIRRCRSFSDSRRKTNNAIRRICDV